MRIVYITSGPRGAGKTTFVQHIKKMQPEISIIDRDEIFIELFGATSLDPYLGLSGYGMEQVYLRLQKRIRYRKNQKIIFDCFNGFHSDREHIIKKLKKYGADKVVCLYFITELSAVKKWFKEKPECKNHPNFLIKKDCRLFHQQMSIGLDEEYEGVWFDNIIFINPLQQVIPGISIL